MASGGRAPRTRLLGRPTRRYHRKTRRRKHDDARRAGAGNPRIGGRREATPFVVLLEDLDGEAGARALRAGARAVLPRSASPEEIRAAVRAAAAGLASLPATLAGALLDGTSRDGARVGTGDHILTPREREILTLLGEGLVNKEIGARLGISEHTVKSHLTAIYEKLEASNRAEAVATGLRRGLVML